MASQAFKTVILGAPGSGKGTISSRITKGFKLNHVASGDLLRINIKNQTEIGKQASTFINKGQLVPDDVMIKFIAQELRKQNSDSWLLDGFPRTIEQAKAFWKIQKIDLALNLIVPFDVIIERVKHRWIHLASGRVYNTDFNPPKVPGKDDITGENLVQRKDDDPEVVLKRLKLYEELTKPVIEFYRRQGILKDFEGKTSDEIWPKVQDCLNKYIKKSQ